MFFNVGKYPKTSLFRYKNDTVSCKMYRSWETGIINKIVHDAGKDVDERRVAGFALNGIQAQIATETDKKSQLDIQLGKVNQQLTDAQGKLENLENQQSEIDQKIRENQASILSDKKALLEKQKELSTLETELKKQQ